MPVTAMENRKTQVWQMVASLPPELLQLFDKISASGARYVLAGEWLTLLFAGEKIFTRRTINCPIFSPNTMHELVGLLAGTFTRPRHGDSDYLFSELVVEETRIRVRIVPFGLSWSGAATEVPTLFHEFSRRWGTRVDAWGIDVQAAELYDPHDAIADFDRKILRPIGTASSRFDLPKYSSDLVVYARYLAERYHLGFRIDSQLVRAMNAHAHQVLDVPRDEVGRELNRILASPGGGHGIRLLGQTAVLQELIPEIAALIRQLYNRINWFEYLCRQIETLPDYTYPEGRRLNAWATLMAGVALDPADPLCARMDLVESYLHQFSVSQDDSRRILPLLSSSALPYLRRRVGLIN